MLCDHILTESNGFCSALSVNCRRIFSISLSVLLLTATSLRSETQIPAAVDHSPAYLQTGENDDILDVTQEEASKILLGAAEWFDDFFDDGRYLAEENKSRAKLKLSFAYTENDDFEFRPSINWRIHLPKLSKKANLLISVSDDEDFEADKTPGSSNPATENNKNDLSAAVQYFVRETKKINLSTTFGGSFNYLYGGLRFRHSKDFGPWQGRFVDRLSYYTDDGGENKASYDLERRFSEKWLFRTTASLFWYEDQDGLPHSLLFRLYQFLGEDRAVSYGCDNFFDTEPDHDMTDLQLRIRYRQRFHRDWLVLEIAPQVTFPLEYDREANMGIIIKLEADFGYLEDWKPLQNVFNF